MIAPLADSGSAGMRHILRRMLIHSMPNCVIRRIVDIESALRRTAAYSHLAFPSGHPWNPTSEKTTCDRASPGVDSDR